jgi:hypothetical protein
MKPKTIKNKNNTNFENGRRPQFFKSKLPKFIFKGRRPQFVFENGRQPETK